MRRGRDMGFEFSFHISCKSVCDFLFVLSRHADCYAMYRVQNHWRLPVFMQKRPSM